MAAPKGNEFWRQRSKHGRDKIFSTPEILWEAAQEYFEATDKRKWNKVDFKGKDAEEVLIPTDTPYTLTGLRLFIDVDAKTWLNYKNNKDFFQVITRIEEIIYTQKFEGATVGAYNANIIARDLGLADKSEVKNSGTVQTVTLTPEEAKELNKALEDEY